MEQWLKDWIKLRRAEMILKEFGLIDSKKIKQNIESKKLEKQNSGRAVKNG
jgi:hypothetical protein